MENLLRNVHEERAWSTRGVTLDKLIQNLVGNRHMSDNLERMLKLISKPLKLSPESHPWSKNPRLGERCPGGARSRRREP